MRPAAFARKLRGLGAAAAIGLEPEARDPTSGNVRRPLSAAPRPGRSATWPDRRGNGQAAGPLRLAAALTAARPNRGPAPAARRLLGPRFLVDGSKILGAEGGAVPDRARSRTVQDLFVEARQAAATRRRAGGGGRPVPRRLDRGPRPAGGSPPVLRRTKVLALVSGSGISGAPGAGR